MASYGKAKKTKNYGGAGMKNWSKVKSGGPAFKEVSVPVNTKSRKVPSGC